MTKPTFYSHNKTNFTIPEEYRSIFNKNEYMVVARITKLLFNVNGSNTAGSMRYYINESNPFSEYNSSTGKGTINASRMIGAYTTYNDNYSSEEDIEYFIIPKDYVDIGGN